jgi:single-stranded DNA-binding protein
MRIFRISRGGCRVTDITSRQVVGSSSVAVFGKAAETAAELKKGDRVYCEGTIKIDSWRGSDGADKHGLSVASFKIDKTHQIGRNRTPKREQPEPAASGRERAVRSDYAPAGGVAGLNDDIPEFR